jgi:hypothetical protein
MSGSIENLLLRNLHEVFGERDPRGLHVGRCGLEDVLSPSKRSSRAMSFRRSAALAPLQDSRRLAWSFVPPHEQRRITRLDVAAASAAADLGALHLSRSNGRVTRERRNVRPSDHGDKR